MDILLLCRSERWRNLASMLVSLNTCPRIPPVRRIVAKRHQRGSATPGGGHEKVLSSSGRFGFGVAFLGFAALF